MEKLIFGYEARDAQGKTVSGQIQASNKQEAFNLLKKQKLQIWNINEIHGTNHELIPSFLNRPIFIKRKLNAQQLSMILQQLASLLKAGIPLDRCLALLTRVPREKLVTEFLTHAYHQVRSGQSLSHAWGNEFLGFPSFGLSMLQAGEASGNLEVALDQIATVLDDNEKLRRLLITSLSYPFFLLGISIIVVVGLLVYAVPQFEVIFSMWGGDLPLATRFLVSISDTLRNSISIVVIGILLGIAVIIIGRFTRQGRLSLDSAILRIPILGIPIRDSSSARLFRTLSVLLKGGVNLTDALMTAADAGGNIRLAIAIRNSANAVSNGSDLAVSLRKEKVFPEVVVELLSLGTETGEIALVTEQCAEFLEEETHRRVKNLTALLEPFMILFMALVVGFVVIAILVPVVTIMDIPL